MKKVSSNIWKLNLIQVFRWAMFVMPVVVLFYQENGLSMAEVIILQAVFSILIVALEIPSGYFADIVGRKKSIIVGSVFSFFGYLSYSFSHSFETFVVSEVLLGIGLSFISGADSAMLYDSLSEVQQEGSYVKREGRMSSMQNFSEGAASILGGFIAAAFTLRTPIYFEAAAMFLTIPLAFSLIEPTRQKTDLSAGYVKSLIKIVRFSLHDHKEVKWLIIYAGLVGAFGLTSIWFIQPFWKIAGLPIAFFGIAWALLQFMTGITSIYAHKIENFLGRRVSLISLFVLSLLAFALLSVLEITLLTTLVFLLLYFVRGINTPVLKDYVNRLIPADTRATVLSVKAMISRTIFAITGPLIGWISDLYTMQTALGLAGGIFLVSGLIALLFLHKAKALRLA